MVGCVEINGDQNYTNWETLRTLLPEGLATKPLQNGVFPLDNAFYKNSGKLFEQNGYARLFK